VGTLQSEVYEKHMERYRMRFEIANELECSFVRMMNMNGEMILFGTNGAENWVPTSRRSSGIPARPCTVRKSHTPMDTMAAALRADNYRPEARTLWTVLDHQ